MVAKLNLKAAREAAKLTQTDAGKLIGVNRNTIRSYETGESSPSIDVLERLCGAYGFTVCMVKSSEYSKIRQILAILAEK